jgi:hypothetical protein
MFLVAGDAAKSWGADLPGSPVMAADDPEERATILVFIYQKKGGDSTVGAWGEELVSGTGAVSV